MATGRPDVLGYPSPTTSRFLIFAVALLASALFVGNWIHSQTLGDEWLARVRVCDGQFPGGATQLASSDPRAQALHRGFVDCTAGVERERTAITTATAAAVALAAVGTMFLAPYFVRRRRRLRPLGPRLAGAEARFAELAAESRVAGRVRAVVGTARQRDAFSFGAPGRQYVALPPALAVRWRDAALFDPLIRHELAHIRHRDVSLAWLARSVWYVLVPLLVLPVVVGAVGDDPSLLPGYLWRALVLAVVVALVSAALLRSREYAADLRAAQLGRSWEEVATLVVQRIPRPATRGRPRIRALARHPSPEDRGAVLAAPERATSTGFVDGLTGGFLAALSMPLVVAALTPILTTFTQAPRAYLIAACLLGPVLGGSVGLGTWRAALYARPAAGGGLFTVRSAGGVSCGFLLGQAASLQQVGAGSVTGLRSPAWLLVTAAVAGGAAVLSSGLGVLWSDLAPRIGLRGSWIAGLLLNSVLFGGVLWSTQIFLLLADNGGWRVARDGLTTVLAVDGMAAVGVVLLVAAVLALLLPSRTSVAPAWLTERGVLPWPASPRLGVARPSLVGLAAGAAGAAVIVVFRLWVGAAPSDDELVSRVLSFYWVAGAASAVAVVVLAVQRGPRGIGAGLVAGPVAAATVTALFLLFNVTYLGGSVNRQVVEDFLRNSVVLGLYLTCLVLPAVGALAAIVHPRAAPVRWLLPAAAALTVAATAPLIAVRHDLVGTTPASKPVVVANPADPRAELATYLQLEAQPLISAYGAIVAAGREIEADPTSSWPAKAQLLDQQVVSPMDALAAQALRYPVVGKDLRAVHAEAVAALHEAAEAWRTRAEAYATGDVALLARTPILTAEESRHWSAWLTGLDSLRSVSH